MDGQTDRILIARPRLYSTQRGRGKKTWQVITLFKDDIRQLANLNITSQNSDILAMSCKLISFLWYLLLYICISNKYGQKYRRDHVLCRSKVLSVSPPEGRPSIQCHLTELLTGRAWASIQKSLLRTTLESALSRPKNCWNALLMSSSVMIGSVEFLPAQNCFASFQLNTEPLV